MNTTTVNANTTTARNRIRYRVVRNAALSKARGIDTYTAQVDTSAPYNLDMVATEMAKGRFPFAKEDVLHVLTTFAEYARDILATGGSINVGGVVTLRPTLRGTFMNAEEGYNKAFHRLAVTASVGKVLRDATANSLVLKVGDNLFPTMTTLMNSTDGLEDTLYSQGGGILLGKNLGFDAAADDEGLFVELNGMETKCDIESANAERIYFRVKNTFAEEEEGLLIFKTRSGDADRATPTRIEMPFTAKPAQ